MAIRNEREMEAMTTGRRQKLLSVDGYRLAGYATFCHKHQASEATRGDRTTGSRRRHRGLSGDALDRRVATRVPHRRYTHTPIATSGCA